MENLKSHVELVQDIKLSFKNSAKQIREWPRNSDSEYKFECLYLNFSGILDRAIQALEEAAEE